MEGSMSSNDNQKWVPRNERMAMLMKMAKIRATEEHAQMEQIRESSMSSERKPSKAVTKRQRSSKRSAEISRAKYSKYVTLLEEENEKEVAKVSQLKQAINECKKDMSEVMLQIKEFDETRADSGKRGRIWSKDTKHRHEDQNQNQGVKENEVYTRVCGGDSHDVVAMVDTGAGFNGGKGDGDGAKMMINEISGCDGSKKEENDGAAMENDKIVADGDDERRRREEMRIVKEKLKISNIIDPVPSYSSAAAIPPSITQRSTMAMCHHEQLDHHHHQHHHHQHHHHDMFLNPSATTTITTKTSITAAPKLSAATAAATVSSDAASSAAIARACSGSGIVGIDTGTDIDVGTGGVTGVGVAQTWVQRYSGSSSNSGNGSRSRSTAEGKRSSGCESQGCSSPQQQEQVESEAEVSGGDGDGRCTAVLTEIAADGRMVTRNNSPRCDNNIIIKISGLYDHTSPCSDL